MITSARLRSNFGWLVCRAILATTFALALGACGDDSSNNGNGDEQTAAVVTGVAQKGPFQPGGSASAVALGGDGSAAGTSVTATISTDGAFAIPDIDWGGPTQLTMSGAFFNEFTGNFAGNLELHGTASLPGDADANVNLFTHFVAARTRHLMAAGEAFGDARDQARSELASIMGINALPNTLDLLQDDGDSAHQDDSANLLLFSAATLAAGINQPNIDVLAADFASDGKINGVGKAVFDDIKQATANHPNLLAIARSHLTNQYSVTPPDDTDGQRPAWAPPLATDPVAAFTLSGSLKVGESVSFDAAGSTGDGLAYAWDFGDGDTATGVQTTHTFTVADDYTVTLRVTDSDSRTDTTSQQLTITDIDVPPAPPEANFTVIGDQVAGSSLSFDANSSTGDGLTYGWDFGDGDTATGVQTTHAFADADDYTVTLTVTDSEGRTDVASQSLTIGRASTLPEADFTVSGDLAAGSNLAFNASASSGDGLTYYWNFGDGDAGRNSQIAHAYDLEGSYTVELTVTDVDGNRDTASLTLTIATGPQPSATDGLIKGSVIDTGGNPVEGVKVSLINAEHLVGGDRDATTDADGKTMLSNMPTGVEFVFKLTKAGYADRFVRTNIPARASDAATFSATITERATTQTLSNAEDGGNVIGADGTAIELPASALVDASGNPVSGSVEVALTPVDVSDADARNAFPGSFAAADNNGDSGVLLSFGVAEYHLTQGGERLQLAPGKQATLTVPVYIDQHSDGSPVTAGDHIPLWSLDETSGQWVQEGMGTVVSDSNSPTGLGFEMVVGHLSWYNCDDFVETYRPIPQCKVDNSSGLPELDISETCFINGSTVDAGPYSGATTNIHSDNNRALPVPAGIEYQLIATARNGTLQGEVTVNGAAGASENIDIVLSPAGGNNGGADVISLPYNDLGAIDPVGETDRYTFPGQAGVFVQVQAGQGDGSTLYGTLELHGPNGQLLGSDDFIGSSLANFVTRLPTDGDYTVSIKATQNAPGGYRLLVEEVPEVSLDENIEGVISAARGSTHRVFHGTAGTLIGLVDVRSAGSNVSLRVNDVNGNPIASYHYSGADQRIAELPADGPYILTIYSHNAGDAYRTAIARIEPPQLLALDGAGRATVTGNIQVNGDRQFYRLVAAGGDGLYLRLAPAAGGALNSGSANVSVYRQATDPFFEDPLAGGPTVSDDNVNGDDSESHLHSTGMRLPGDGSTETYIIEVSALIERDGEELGNYELRVDTAPAKATIVVDDDLAQCADADTRSLHAAAYAVTDGGTIDICDGLYSEHTSVTAPDGSFELVGRNRAGVVLRSADPDRQAVLGDAGLGDNSALIALKNLTLQSQGEPLFPDYFSISRVSGATNVTIEPAPGEEQTQGRLAIYADGAVIDGLDMTAGRVALYIRADNVTVRNSSFTGAPGTIDAEFSDNLLFENNTATFERTSNASQYFRVKDSSGLRMLNNHITITADEPPSFPLAEPSISIEDVGDSATGTVVRANTVSTPVAGLYVDLKNAGANIAVEQNRFHFTAPYGGVPLDLITTRGAKTGSLLMRNNIFYGATGFDGGVAKIRGTERFTSIDIINNSWLAKPTGPDDTPPRCNGCAMLLVSPFSQDLTGPLPINFINNILIGWASSSTTPAGAINIPGATTINDDNNLFGDFDYLYKSGGTSSGLNNINIGIRNPENSSYPFFVGDPFLLEVNDFSQGVDNGQGPMAGGPPIPGVDYSGESRPQHGSYDIGAHENVF
ncbi:carboxypeptidase-like regulatory domain-containing protein [Alcanivorax sp. 24]|uniref:carboxypeptidase-like regulatory domain-containing protein n=1 Tax=Alcanivorax sp. 24 TaxID=2545266 RepID=UPI001414F65E|nr:carboxypeptidase-like regulatory domain-containing protein [Alcanivorax sp. 24]